MATGGTDDECICFAIRALLRNAGAVPPILFRESEIVGIDLKARTITTNHGLLQYDYLVFALGSTSNYYGIPGVEQNIIPLKTINDGTALHNRILESFEAETDEQKRRELLTFVIIGGGFDSRCKMGQSFWTQPRLMCVRREPLASYNREYGHSRLGRPLLGRP